MSQTVRGATRIDVSGAADGWSLWDASHDNSIAFYVCGPSGYVFHRDRAEAEACVRAGQHTMFCKTTDGFGQAIAGHPYSERAVFAVWPDAPSIGSIVEAVDALSDPHLSYAEQDELIDRLTR